MGLVLVQSVSFAIDLDGLGSISAVGVSVSLPSARCRLRRVPLKYGRKRRRIYECKNSRLPSEFGPYVARRASAFFAGTALNECGLAVWLILRRGEKSRSPSIIPMWIRSRLNDVPRLVIWRLDNTVIQ